MSVCHMPPLFSLTIFMEPSSVPEPSLWSGNIIYTIYTKYTIYTIHTKVVVHLHGEQAVTA